MTPLLQSTLRKSLFSCWLRKLGDNYLDARRFSTEWHIIKDWGFEYVRQKYTNFGQK